MRTEVKVALIIGMVVLGGGIIFTVNQSQKTGKGVTDVVPMHKTPTGPTGPEKPGVRPTATPVARATPSGPTGPLRGPVTPLTPPPALPVSVPPTPGTEAGAAPRATTAPTPIALPPRVEPAAPPTEESPKPSVESPPATPTPAARPATPGVSIPPPPAPEPKPTGPTGPPPRAPERPAERPTPGTEAVRKHTVAEGDTLSSIAEEYLGDRNLWPRIKAANPDLTNPDVLLVGQVLIIPPKEGPLPKSVAEPSKPAAESPKPTPEPAKPAAENAKSAGARPGAEKPSRNGRATTEPETKPQTKARTYKVAPGDSLVKIARAVLKDPNRWREIYELNKSKIPNPDVLPVGVELRLPDK